MSLCKTGPLFRWACSWRQCRLLPHRPSRANAVSPLAEARYRAAVKQYDETWAYYRQARIDSYQVYVWSRFVLESRRAMAETGRARHGARRSPGPMKKLEELVKKIRRLGFGRSYDVGASEYYRLEAELWLEQAEASGPASQLCRQAPGSGLALHLL